VEVSAEVRREKLVGDFFFHQTSGEEERGRKERNTKRGMQREKDRV
jgi:hypothetical protein